MYFQFQFTFILISEHSVAFVGKRGTSQSLLTTGSPPLLTLMVHPIYIANGKFDASLIYLANLHNEAIKIFPHRSDPPPHWYIYEMPYCQ